MTSREYEPRENATGERIVVIGSYRHAFESLISLCAQLEQRGFHVVHPLPHATAAARTGDFVWLSTDQTRDIASVQRRVFDLMADAHAVVVFCPGGRIGVSAALEIGYALCAGARIVPTELPSDPTLAALIGTGDPRLRERLGLPAAGS